MAEPIAVIVQRVASTKILEILIFFPFTPMRLLVHNQTKTL
jgi:hypothetical protein